MQLPIPSTLGKVLLKCYSKNKSITTRNKGIASISNLRIRGLTLK